MAVEKWPVVSDDIRQQMARMAAAAAWGLGKAMVDISEGREGNRCILNSICCSYR